MVNRNLVSAKLTELADRTARVRDKVPSSAPVLAQDRDLLDILIDLDAFAREVASWVATRP